MGPDTAGGILGGEGAIAFALLPPDKELVSRSRKAFEVELRGQIKKKKIARGKGKRGRQDNNNQVFFIRGGRYQGNR